jgi:hypothetical protein
MDHDHSTSNGSHEASLRQRDVDSNGRLIPISEEERLARLQRQLAGLDALANIPADESDTDEIWDEVLRNLGMDPRTGGPLEP